MANDVQIALARAYMRKSVSLANIRDVVGHRCTFVHEGLPFMADVYAVGQARLSGAYVAITWCVEPALGWRTMRYGSMRDLVVGEAIQEHRNGFEAREAEVGSIVRRFLPRRRWRPSVAALELRKSVRDLPSRIPAEPHDAWLGSTFAGPLAYSLNL